MGVPWIIFHIIQKQMRKMTFQSSVSQVEHPIFSARFSSSQRPNTISYDQDTALTSDRQQENGGKMLSNAEMTKDEEKLNDIPHRAVIQHNFM